VLEVLWRQLGEAGGGGIEIHMVDSGPMLCECGASQACEIHKVDSVPTL